MKRASFVDKEKQVLVAVAEKIGTTLGHVAAFRQVAKKASRAAVKPMRRRRLARTARRKSSSKAARSVRRTARRKTRLSRRRK